MKPLAIDLFTGLHGWSAGLIAEGFRVVGFDLEDMSAQFGQPKPPHFQLVIQDVLTIHGKQFKDAALIVASPPCQEYSYMAMPWSRAKQKIRDYETGVRDVKQLTALFDACFRIQREAIDAAGHHIPLVVENVRGAQRWVGRSRWNFGSFHLWGDVPALMPMTVSARKVPGFRFDGSGKSFQTAAVEGVKVPTMGAGWYPPDHPKHVAGLAFNGHAERAIKNTGGSWFNIGSPGQKVTNRNPVHGLAGVKLVNGGDGYERNHQNAFGWKPARTNSKSPARKAASAMIAKIPFALSRHIAAAWHPRTAVSA